MVTKERNVSARQKRRAAVMAAVLVCLLVVMLVGAALLQNLILRHRHTRLEVLQLQAMWLAESAVGRAEAQLQLDRAYTGESWRVVLDKKEETAGLVEITVTDIPEKPDQRLLKIEAIYPERDVKRASHQHELIISLPTLGDSL